MSRKVGIGTLLVLVFSALVAVWWRNAGEAAPQIVTLPGGLSYRFAGTTYGTNHVMGPRKEMAIQRMPKPLANIVRQLLGYHLSLLNTHTTSKPALCAWFEPLGTNGVASPAITYAMLANESGVLSGERKYVTSWSGFGAPPWLNLDFSVVPRRSHFIECRFYEYLPAGDYREAGRVRFPNPLFGDFPHWQSEPLPATRLAGDIEVTLESFSTDHSGSSETVAIINGTSVAAGNRKSVTRFVRSRPGDEVHAAFELSFKSPRGTNELWTIESAELSDATGNQIGASSRTESENRRFAIGPALWPDEPAWKLRLELERKGSFLPEELVTFSAVSVPAVGETNSVPVSNTLAGVQFKRVEFRRKNDLTSSSWSTSGATCIRLEHSGIPKGYSLDFVKIVTGNGTKLETLSRSWSDTSQEFFLKSIPEGVANVDITYSVQPTRTVEFLVKPEVAAQDPPK